MPIDPAQKTLSLTDTVILARVIHGFEVFNRLTQVVFLLGFGDGILARFVSFRAFEERVEAIFSEELAHKYRVLPVPFVLRLACLLKLKSYIPVHEVMTKAQCDAVLRVEARVPVASAFVVGTGEFLGVLTVRIQTLFIARNDFLGER